MKKLHLIATIILFLAVSYLIAENYIENKLHEKLAKRLYSQIALDSDPDLNTSDTLILNTLKKFDEVESAFHEYIRKDSNLIFNHEISENLIYNQKFGLSIYQSVSEIIEKYPNLSNNLKHKSQLFNTANRDNFRKGTALERLLELNSIKQELLFLNEKLKCQ